MHLKTRGIVLHSIKYSETSVITKIYTEKLGLQSYIVKGIRSTKSNSKAALLQPLTLLDLDVLHRGNKALQFIKEFRRGIVYQSLPFDTLKSTTAFFLLEVISKAIREHEPNGEMFEFIYNTFCALDKMKKLNPDFHLLFLVHFSSHLGFSPHRNFSEVNCFFEINEGEFIGQGKSDTVLNQKESLLMNHLLKSSLYESAPVTTSRAERKLMLGCLLKYYTLHIENFNLKSPEVLEEVLD